MRAVGIICLVIAALFWGNPILWTIGVILVVLGLIFWILGAMGRAVGGRRHYYQPGLFRVLAVGNGRSRRTGGGDSPGARTRGEIVALHGERCTWKMLG